MNKKTDLKSDQNSSIILRSIDKKDLEDLRTWKNANKNSFFHTSEITSEQQNNWYQGYLKRPEDFMFMVYVNNMKIGCMGFRELSTENQIDVYNIILGNEEYGKKGYMGIALKTMCNFAHSIYKNDITVKVLKTNPASNWYKKINFIELSPQIDYFYFKLNKEHFEKYTFETTT
ncbi:MAG: GNAT family N-acetyltransferase [Bacteroidetes bacterium]|nr:GNAT family N-acetyltransferase [Bacteroidota bacterium]